MHDFHCRNAADMHSTVLAGRVRELKETQKGVSYMCSELRKLREEGRVEGLAEGLEKGEHSRAVVIAGRLLGAGMDHAEVAEYTGLSLEEVDRLSA